MKFNYKLYLVTDQAACGGRRLEEVVEAAVKGGVDIVQIREKSLPEKEFLEKTLRIKDILDGYGIPLIVNDNLPVAIQSKAAGIHVGNKDISPVKIHENWPGCGILGYSIEYEDQLNYPNAELADYLALSPIFSTPTKTDTVTEWGLAGITKIRALTPQPLVAIGSINTSNAASIIRAGADCLAVVSAICSAPDPAKAAEKIRNEIERAEGRQEI